MPLKLFQFVSVQRRLLLHTKKRRATGMRVAQPRAHITKTLDYYFKQRGVFYTSLDEIGLRAMSAFIHSFKVYHPYTSLKYTSAEL